MESPWNSRVPSGLEEHAGDKQFATTLARGLELLHCFTPERPILGNSEMASMLKLPKATVSRLTYTLMRLGYLIPPSTTANTSWGLQRFRWVTPCSHSSPFAAVQVL